MMTEREKMTLGLIYNPNCEELIKDRFIAHKLCTKYNKLYDNQMKKRNKIIDKLIPNKGSGVYLQGPIYFDYGYNFILGNNVYANFNLTVLDICKVTVGDDVYFGPNVMIASPVHPMIPSERNMYVDSNGILTDKEYGKPITINKNCWIASNVVICGGVTIGEGCVIGAGSVVTKDIPPHSFAAGNPCKVIKKITEEDSIYKKPELWEEQ